MAASKSKTLKLTYAAVCLALCLVLPFLIGQIPQIGQALSPMHIPVLLCGFLCGWPYGLVVGFIAPLLRSVLFGMPAMMPGMALVTAPAMNAEKGKLVDCRPEMMYRARPQTTRPQIMALISVTKM